MGKRARVKREKIAQEKGEIKSLKEKIYHEKNPWLKFWLRVDFWIYAVCLAFIVAFPFIMKDRTFFMDNTSGSSKNSVAVLHTSMGDISIELYAADAPKTVDNFVKLAKENFYENLLWHRVIKGFVIQSGDPNGDGTGGPGYEFADEINSYQFVVGAVGMANAGADTNGSQFFIVNGPTAEASLNGKYTNFGQVIAGLDVVEAISEAPVDENDKPLSPITLDSVEIK